MLKNLFLFTLLVVIYTLTDDQNKKGLKVCVGIDLGTTYSSVAIVPKSGVADLDILDIGGGRTTLPSVIRYDPIKLSAKDKITWIPKTGWDVFLSNLKNPTPNSYIYAFKRYMGIASIEDEPKLKGINEKVTYSIIEEKKGENTSLYMEIKDINNKTVKKVSAIDASATILETLIEIVNEKYGKENIENVIITVPAYFSETQVKATKTAATIANLTVQRTVNEPVAAAYAYQIRYAQEPVDSYLVFDFGGGTLDISILEYESGVLEVVTYSGSNFLGGENINDCLFKYFYSILKNKNILLDDVEMLRLRGFTEKFKISLCNKILLSENNKGGKGNDNNNKRSNNIDNNLNDKINLDNNNKRNNKDNNDKDNKDNNNNNNNNKDNNNLNNNNNNNDVIEFSDDFIYLGNKVENFTLSDKKFKSICKPIIDEIIDQLTGPTGVLTKYKNKWEKDKSDIQKVLLVGGSTRVPFVREILSQLFTKEKVSSELNPDTVVAEGAALYAANMLDWLKDDSLHLIDVVPMNIGICVDTDTFESILDMESAIPASQVKTFTTGQDNQSMVKIKVAQGVRYQYHKNQHLGQFELTLKDPKPKGIPQIEVSVSINKEREIFVKATDKATGLEEKIQFVKKDYELSDQRRQEMLKDRDSNKSLDESLKKKDSNIKELETYKDSINHSIIQLGEKINESERTLLFKEISKVEEFLKDAKNPMAG
ncbi:Molecular chaperones HSP70/HSC70, HSP70 superfamily, partial [Pseudoloma neurophilia]